MRAGASASKSAPTRKPDFLRAARDAAAAVALDEADRQGLAGAAIGEKLRARRLEPSLPATSRTNEIPVKKAFTA